MSATVAGTLVVAGALMRPHWLPAEQLKSHLPLLSRLLGAAPPWGLAATVQSLAPQAGALPRELAHDQWLRKAIDVPAGALAAVRRIAPLNGCAEGWLMEPGHFHLGRDHLLLLAGAVDDLSMTDATHLLDAIRPALDADGLAPSILSPTVWLLTPTRPWQLEFASAEAASGRNVAGYLPIGPDERRYRRLLNEIQMTWHDHAVNSEREARGELPVNSVWTSGPVTAGTLAAWNASLAQQRFTFDDSLLPARLRDDQSSWLEALQALDARLHDRLQNSDDRSILLCGDRGAHWLTRRPAGPRAWPGTAARIIAGLVRGARPRTEAGDRQAAALTALFTEVE